MTEASGIDWEEALLNAPRIPDGAAYPARWAAAAAAFRERVAGEVDIAYGEAPRERLDIFPPEGPSRGLVVVVHGGFWRSFGKSDWSHLAAGARARGWSVAVPGYTLAPALRI